MLRRIARLATTDGQARFGRRLSSIFCVLSVTIAGFASIYGAGRPEAPGWMAFSMFAGAMCIGVVFAQLFYELEGWFEQRGRDLKAAAIFEGLTVKAPVEDYVLYLRPFASTDQISETHANVVPIRTGVGAPTAYLAGEDRLEFEAVVEKALNKFGPLIALGEPMEHLGAGRIKVTDDTWQAVVRLLLNNARLIVLLPSSREGTLWEVDQILSSDAKGRTLVIDPPNELGCDGEYDPGQEWGYVREAFAKHGVQLPDDDPNGLIVRLSDEGKPKTVRQLHLDNKSPIRRLARDILSAADKSVRAERKRG